MCFLAYLLILIYPSLEMELAFPHHLVVGQVFQAIVQVQKIFNVA